MIKPIEEHLDSELIDKIIKKCKSQHSTALNLNLKDKFAVELTKYQGQFWADVWLQSSNGQNLDCFKKASGASTQEALCNLLQAI